MKTLVIIPAYNEEHSIRGVIEDLRQHSVDADILVVDDGSKDATGKVAKSLGAIVLTLPFNLGIGGAVQAGFRYAKRNGYDLAFQFDGDGQHRADQVRTLLKPILDGEADVVIGSRFLQVGAYDAEVARLFAIKVLSRIISMLVGRTITDPSSGFRAANSEVIAFYNRYYPDDYPEPEAIVLLCKAGFRVSEVPVLMRKRLIGSSSITLFRGFYYMVKVTLAVLIDMIKRI